MLQSLQMLLMSFQTISRTSRKSRPTSVAAFREHEKDSESENESESTQTRTVLSDIMDFGVDIFADQGWDTDLEEGGWTNNLLLDL